MSTTASTRIVATPTVTKLRDELADREAIRDVLIVIDGSKAEVESYFQGYHSVPAKNGIRRDHVAGGRYLDIFEKRNDEWRILKRFVITDWFRDYPDTGDWNTGPFGMQVERGDQKPADKSYDFFSRLV